ncbi:hypothetical protein H112_03413 [Trichophyton rubrum D6]|uniref:Uncharacterized protein n=3 Tax=Trichophyton TaxID=5550 RepID=F2SQ75_TRIRC|nr:uncharacterized protein TERG_04742 [Trichophyton rubrum CBS 118892]EZF24014.1 hypothetical protein H100_03418 [Trichophyton rubrum MR850]EZF43048.1 hypothetical protein H102_03413 [Trichophyton rubrum CBS 100081]EZF53692.1 hypothetical protein H103_03422 [Trichophyton rubrum CBS 288.86]EZF64312.1 hypothetical protein H104_03407 [Trichophyton rubrum CBS 289.86]EZF74935.1 hypothetical protein H105_03434 [Trichophyton soudanense CBS 452.61]EZF85611.1 hypothetical protein H110_03419 [Trichophy
MHTPQLRLVYASCQHEASPQRKREMMTGNTTLELLQLSSRLLLIGRCTANNYYDSAARGWTSLSDRLLRTRSGSKSITAVLINGCSELSVLTTGQCRKTSNYGPLRIRHVKRRLINTSINIYY